MKLLKDKFFTIENFMHCSVLLYLLNNVIICLNKNYVKSGILLDTVFNHFIKISLITSFIGLSLFVCSRRKEYFFDKPI